MLLQDAGDLSGGLRVWYVKVISLLSSIESAREINRVVHNSSDLFDGALIRRSRVPVPTARKSDGLWRPVF
jgi:hypothetical protein